MIQRWRFMHWRAGLRRMGTLRHAGLRYGPGKGTGKVDRRIVKAEIKNKLGRISESNRSFPSMSVTKFSTMHCCLKNLAGLQYLETGYGSGSRSVKSDCYDQLSANRRLRCQRNGGNYNLYGSGLIAKRRYRSLHDLVLRYSFNLRHIHEMNLRPFFICGLSAQATFLGSCKLSSCREGSVSSRSPAQPIPPSWEEAPVAGNGSHPPLPTARVTDEPLNEAPTHINETLVQVDFSNETVSPSEGEGSTVEIYSSIEEVVLTSPKIQLEPTIIVFDIETTGFLKPCHKIIEIACRDLAGGERSTLATLVNPFQAVPMSSTLVHKISSEMVNREDIPSWTEVMTAFIDFVEGRRKGIEPVILVAHNARRFDVPFIVKESRACSIDVPSHWYFVDTIDLAKAMLKKRFGTVGKHGLQFLYYDCYNLPQLNDAHRAGVDVDMLSSVFGKLLTELEMPVTALLNQAFKAEDIYLKPDLLVREDNDRYTSLANEVNTALLEQPMVESAEFEQALGIESQSCLKEGDAPISPTLANERLLRLTRGSESLSGMTLQLLEGNEGPEPLNSLKPFQTPHEEVIEKATDGGAATGGPEDGFIEAFTETKDQFRTKEDEAFNVPISLKSTQVPKEKFPGLPEPKDVSIKEASDALNSDKMSAVIIPPPLEDGQVIERPISTFNVPDEELLGMSLDRGVIHGAVTPSGKDNLVTEVSNCSRGDEYEDALGLVLGSSEAHGFEFSPTHIKEVGKIQTQLENSGGVEGARSGVALRNDNMEAQGPRSSLSSNILREEITSFSRVDSKEENRSAVSLKLTNRDPMPSLETTLRELGVVEVSLETSDLSALSEEITTTATSYTSYGMTNKSSQRDLTIGVSCSESSEPVRALSHATGDGALHPLNIGRTLLKNKKGKRRGTGDVQTPAVRGLAQIVADCEDQLSVAEASLLEIQDTNYGDSEATQIVLDGNNRDAQKAVFEEKTDGASEQLHTSSVNLSLLSPMMKQYVETKRQRPKFLLLSRVGDFYEAFFEDAKRLAHACNIRLSAVDGGKLLERKVPMAGVPYHKIDIYLRILLGKGIGVVKQEQVTTADAKGGAIIERQVSAVLTPGTLLDEGMLEDSCNNFLVAIFPHSDDNGTWGLAYADISTGEFQATQGQGRPSLLHELLRLQPSEVIFPANGACVTDRTTGAVRPYGMPSGLCYSSRPTSEFFPGAAEKRLQSSFGEESLETFGMLRSSHAIRAAGGLLGYVHETQKLINEAIPLQRPCYYSTLDSMHMDDTVRSHLELLKTSRWGKVEGSLVWALDRTQTAMGGRLLRRWLLWPLINYDEICLRQDAVEVFVKNHELRLEFRKELARIADMERVASRIAWKRADARDLVTVAESIQVLPSLAVILEGMSLNSYFVAAAQTPIAAVEWATKVNAMVVAQPGNGVQAGGVIKEGVDDTLDELRKDVRETHNWLEDYEKQERKRTGIPSLEEVMKSVGSGGSLSLPYMMELMVPDFVNDSHKVGYNKNMGHYVSIRKNKLKDDAIPNDFQRLQSLKAEERFVTLPLLECETRRLAALVKASEREEEVLVQLKDEIVSLLEPIREYSQALAALDVLSTFADLAVKREYCRPRILETGREITIIGGRHPVVEISLPEDTSFIPNSVFLGFKSEKASSSQPSDIAEASSESSEEVLHEVLTGENEKWWPRADLVVLTGPNASGKSCYLRQLGLIQLLAQAGSYVPAKHSQLSIADGLYTRVGAVDDLAAGQSTFRIEMVEAANILNRATANSLVLLDEVGRGTGSQEGAVIARAIIEYLSQKVHARTIFSTHYHGLHILDQDFQNIANYHFQATELENGQVIFNHAVKPGYALQSHAIAVGRGAGLPEWVCNRAAELLDLEEEFCPREIQAQAIQQDFSFSEAPDGEMNADEEPALDNGQTDMKSLRDVDIKATALVQEDHLRVSSGFVVIDPSSDRLGEIDLENGAEALVEDEEVLVTDGSAREKSTLEAGSSKKSVFDGVEESEGHSSNPIEDLSGSVRMTSVMDGANDLDSGSDGEIINRSEEMLGSQNGTVESPSLQEGLEEKWSSMAGLEELWEHVCAALQNQPATQALSKQKGSLVSVRALEDKIYICMGVSALFVRKFQQHEHAAALEAAFASVLHRPVHLQVSVLTTQSTQSS